MHKIIKDFNIKLTAKDILKGQGIDPERASQRLFETAEAVINEAEALLEPVAIPWLMLSNWIIRLSVLIMASLKAPLFKNLWPALRSFMLLFARLAKLWKKGLIN